MLQLANALTHFLEAVHHTGKARALRPAERKLERAIGKIFQRQGKAFVKGLIQHQGAFPPEVKESGWREAINWIAPFVMHEALAEDQIDALLSASEDGVTDDMIAAIQDSAKLMLLAGAKQILSELDFGISFDLKNPRAVAYMEEHGAALVTKINDETRRLTKAIITQAVEEGWSYQRTARALIAQYDGYAKDVPYRGVANRAQFIAVTEAGQAYEAGNFIPVQDLMDSGIEMEKMWDTAPELSKQGPCPDCEANGAEGWIPADQAHASGDDHPLAHPGCYCDELYQVKEK